MYCIMCSLDQKSSVPKDINHGLDHILIGAGNEHWVFAIVARTVRRITNIYQTVVHVVTAPAYLAVAKAIAIIWTFWPV